MARTKQTARRSTGALAPRLQIGIPATAATQGLAKQKRQKKKKKAEDVQPAAAQAAPAPPTRAVTLKIPTTPIIRDGFNNVSIVPAFKVK